MDNGSLFDVTPYTTTLNLADRFGVPPFSTLDTRSGRWRARRAQWDTIDLNSTEGRPENLTYDVNTNYDFAQRFAAVGSTSSFDPVLCELIYRWWTPAFGTILDPFAGGCTRGIVATILGRDYHGVDISQTQIDANEEAAARLQTHMRADARWWLNDASRWQPDVEADAIVTCPPYGTLEKYSDNPADLSTMKAAQFEPAYQHAIALSLSRLKPHRFAIFVVGNYREDGHMIDLVGMTVNALERCGANYYNDLILLNSTASAGMRASAQFNAGRKPCMVHQHIVVAVRGDWKKAAAAAERIDPLDLADETP